MARNLTEMGDLVNVIVDTIPSPILVVDDDVCVLGYNRAASHLLGEEAQEVLRRRAGEILHCIHATEVPEGCGRAPFCRDCIVRNSVTRAVGGQQITRQRARMELASGTAVLEIYLLVTTTPFEWQQQSLVLLLLEDISELMELRGILPICARCKKIRTDDEYWVSIEGYLKRHLDLDFSHGLCPDCIRKLYPQYQK